MGFTIVWPEGVIFGSIMTYHVQILLLVRQPLFDRAALLLTQTSWVVPSIYSSASCPFHKLELHEIGELPATRMLWSSSCRTF